MTEPKFLQNWEPRETAALLRGMPKYLRQVKSSKLLVGLLVVSLLAIVIILPLLQGQESGMRIALSAVSSQSEEGEKPLMVNPRFESVDAKNQPFSITADSAEQLDNDRVKLNKVKGDIALNDGTWLAMQSESGLLNINKNLLLLADEVELFSDEGYEFYTERVQVSLKNASALGDKPVRGNSPMGKIQADAIEITPRGERIRFIDNVKVTIYP
jgi:lipopolysaccharide export system protein LptC